MFGISKSISKKLGLSIILLFLLNIITVSSFFYIFSQQKLYSPAINESGRLRMMSQRVAKNVLLISQGYNDSKEDLIIVSEDYDKTLELLLLGSSERGIVTPSDEIKSNLNKVKSLWDKIRENVKIVSSIEDNNSKQFQNAVTYVKDNNMELLKEANNVVLMYEKESETKQNTLVSSISLVISFLSLLIMAIVILTIRKIVNSIEELNKATKTISRFSLTSNIQVNSQDEVGELAKNFNLMVENMKSSMEKSEV